MSEHTEGLRSYTQPEWVDYHWVIEEHDEHGEVTAEYGYPNEAAAWAAYRILTA